MTLASRWIPVACAPVIIENSDFKELFIAAPIEMQQRVRKAMIDMVGPGSIFAKYMEPFI
jgi:hypothetical protein